MDELLCRYILFKEPFVCEDEFVHDMQLRVGRRLASSPVLVREVPISISRQLHYWQTSRIAVRARRQNVVPRTWPNFLELLSTTVCLA